MRWQRGKIVEIVTKGKREGGKKSLKDIYILRVFLLISVHQFCNNISVRSGYVTLLRDSLLVWKEYFQYIWVVYSCFDFFFPLAY